MAATLTSKISVLLSSLLVDTVGAAMADGKVDTSFQFPLANGVAANQADKLYTTVITRTHGSPAGDIDLAGTVTDPLGATITLARIKAIIVAADPANVNSVVVGGGAPASAVSTIFFDYVATVDAQPALKVRPGGLLVLVAPAATAYAVTATTADKLQIANGDEDGTTSVTATVYVIGASA